MIRAEKEFDKTNIHNKNSHQIKNSKEFFKLIMGIYEKLTGNIILNGDRMNCFSLRSRTRQGFLLSSLLFNDFTVIMRNIRHEYPKRKK